MSRAPGSTGIKTDYNAIPPPPNYVPGLGRGATGFTTRSDIGPARTAPEMPSNMSAAPGARGQDGEAPTEVPETNQFDEFMGNDSGVLASTGEYDEDDKEADAVWEGVDDFMDERRRDRREKRLKEEIEKYRAENPKIAEQFAPLKRKLKEVSADEWNSIPEIGDYTVKQQKRFQSFVPVPDSLLARAAAEKATNSSIDPISGLATPGLTTPMGGGTSTVQNLTAIGEGRGTVLELKLDRMADSVSGQTVVDPKGYLTDLKSMQVRSDSDISDIKKARLLLKSVIQTNPKHAPGWIAAARLEEFAGKLQTARQLIRQGCDECPKSEDVWLEAARMESPDMAKSVLARGVAQLPASTKLWMAAAKLEQDDTAKARVLRKALERNPTSVRLWKAVVELANEEEAKTLLWKATECCPQHVDLWLALARLETYDEAKKVLNRARKAIPTEGAIWVTAAKLEEAQGNADMVDKIIARGIKSLQANGVVVSRADWLKEAETAEKADPPLVLTCRAIIRAVVGLGVEDIDRERTWLADAEEAEQAGRIHSARAIYQHALEAFPHKSGVWWDAAMLEKKHGSKEDLYKLLQEAVARCPDDEKLWLVAAKEKWLDGDVDAARQILNEAYEANQDSEEIWLAAAKLELETQKPEMARALLGKARDSGSSSTERVWMKSAVVERELGDAVAERRILEEGLKRYPGFWKMWMMLGQLEERQGKPEAARAAYISGLKRCSDCVPLWRAAARLEEAAGNVAKARATLEQARLKNPKNEVLWLAAIRTEVRAGNTKAAETLLAKALQDCPTSGILWAEAISMAPRPQRKSHSADAIKRCGNNDPYVHAAVAALFWADRKIDKARSWFTRAVTLEPRIGDIWAQMYKFECQHGSPELQEAVLKKAAEAEPKMGERWCRVAKDPKNAHVPRETLVKKTVVDLDTLPPP